jgi:RNA polymerase sigma-70 factor (ECF subfamily)
VKAISIEEAAELQDMRAADGGLEEENRDRAVRELVLTLPAKYRDVVVLFYFHEMDISAAAKSLHLPEGTVKARLSRAREMLQSKLPYILRPQKMKER